MREGVGSRRAEDNGEQPTHASANETPAYPLLGVRTAALASLECIRECMLPPFPYTVLLS